jgi:hypothetical protein
MSDDLFERIDQLVRLTFDGFKQPVAPQVERGPRFSLEEFCGSHAEQYAFCTDRAPFIHTMCARQSGKTWGDDAILYDNARSYPRSLNVLLHLTGPAVRLANWVPIWKQGLCERYGAADGLTDRSHNEGMMLTTFPNESRVLFGGTDDLKHVKNFLGNRLANGVVIIEEAQDQPLHVVDYILNVMLPPMLTPTTRVIMSGVLPDMPVGRFLDLSSYDPESKTGGKGPGWSHHEWARAANIHTPEAMAQLQAYLKLHGIPIDHPQIQRDWFKRRIWDMTVGAYRYLPARNGYQPVIPKWLEEVYAAHQAEAENAHRFMYAHPIRGDEKDGARFGLMAAMPNPGVRHFSFALDPGATTDRASVQGWGWGDQSREAQHVFDWTTPRKAGLSTGQMFAVMSIAQRVYGAIAQQSGGAMSWRYDAGSSQNTIDNLMRDYGIPLVLAAKKADLKGQVDRNNDLLEQGRAKVMIGSALEQDYQRARFDPDARARASYRWGSAWHPDASEAGRYALQDYFDAYVAPPEKPTDPIEIHRAEVRQMLEEARLQEQREAEETADLGW